MLFLEWTTRAMADPWGLVATSRGLTTLYMIVVTITSQYVVSNQTLPPFLLVGKSFSNHKSHIVELNQ